MRTIYLFFLLTVLTCFSCGSIFNDDEIDYREEMRTFVQEISAYAGEQDSDFIVIPQNGHQLLLNEKSPDTDYLNAIDGLGQESLFFGYTADNLPTPAPATNELLNLLDIGKKAGKTILVTDYCYTSFKINSSYSQNQALGYLSFAAPERDLTDIPTDPSPLPGVNSDDISQLSEAENFLYLLNKSKFENRSDFLAAIQNTNYDLIIIDAFYNGQILTAQEVEQLRKKKNGGERLVISYMSIGEAEDYRYYWQEEWETGNPEWLFRENPDWEGNYKVKYWDPEWKSIIYGDEDAYLQKIINSGFDGVYLDIIDGFEFFENL